MACSEVLFSTEASGQLWNVCAWDSTSTSSIVSFKGGSSGPRTLSLIAGDYLISAVNNKPLIHVWALHRQEQIHLKMVTPGRICALAVSPDGYYCVASVSEKIHVWQVCTGHLLAVLTHHYQPVTVLRFSSDGSHFISAADDNLVLVWFLTRVVQRSTTSLPSEPSTPRHTWSAHSLPVTDVHVGHGGIRARVATASLDQTVKLWELASGQMLANIVFSCGLTSVVMDNTELALYAGTITGHIYHVNLHERPVRVERHIEDDDSRSHIFDGHSKKVTCLAVSMDGTMLSSGSHDNSVKFWDIRSRQCTKTIPHKGPITNLVLVPRPVGLEACERRSQQMSVLPIQSFQRHLVETGGDNGQRTVNVRLRGFDLVQLKPLGGSERDSLVITKEEGGESVKSLKKQVEDLKTINKQLYDHSVELALHANDF